MNTIRLSLSGISCAGCVSRVETALNGVAGVMSGALYSFVRIRDAGSSDSHGTIFPGADIDAVGAISSAPPAVPLPPSIGFLLIGVFALAGGIRRAPYKARQPISPRQKPSGQSI